MNVSVTSQTNIGCFGGNNGAINITASGGADGYSYNWGGGVTSEDRTGLAAGTYSVTVTDANSCTATASATITQPTALNVSVTSQTNVSCFGGNNGAINITASGGTPLYSYNWGGGITTEDRTGLTIGTYTVTVTDANLCTATQSITITQPGALNVAVTSQTNVSCFGGNNGAINITTSGGAPLYSYNWGGGITVEDRAGLTAGTYAVTVTDANLCTVTKTIIITQPAVLTVSTTQINVSCSGGNNGQAMANPAGGTTPYAYVWNNPALAQSTQTVTGLTVGTWAVTVTDNKGCTIVTSVTITEPLELNVSVTTTDATCNQLCNGAANTNVSGGTPPYSYIWSIDGLISTSSSYTGICAGNYNVVVFDNNNCLPSSIINNFTVTEPTALSASVTVVNASCAPGQGACDGTASVNPSGGTPTYNYLWSNGQTYQTISAQCDGNYSVTITDMNSCTFVANTIITAPVPVAFNASVTSSTSACIPDGIITVTAFGGTPPYSYSNIYNPTYFQSSSTFTGLYAGNHYISVKDANGCILLNSNVTVGGPAIFNVTITATPASNCITANGSVTANTTGGTPLYTFLWSNGQTGSTATGLAVGSYNVTVTDNNGCTASNSKTIGSDFSPAFTGTPACGGGSNGTATVIPQNATGPFTYSWSNGQTASTATALMPGSYTVQITDGLGCTAMGTVTIQDATSYTDLNGITVPSTPASQTWNSVTETIKGGIFIPSGVTLTINNSTLQFSETGYMHIDYGEWGIIVDAGATLILNTCTLTSIANCPSMWDGIRVIGTGGFSGSYAATGKVILNTGNLIENAHTAIVSSGYLYYQYYNDGVIKVFPGNTFLNNRKHIVINGLRWSASNFRIEGSDFLCTGPLKDVAKYNNEGTSVFIELINFGIDPLQRINLTGCNFSNTGSFDYINRGIGIKSMHTSFTLQPSCNVFCVPPGGGLVECCGTKNTIQNLTYAVYAIAANSMYNIAIKRNQFTDNYRGVYLQNFYDATITRNDFDALNASISPTPYNLYLNGCTGYIVEENEFLSLEPGSQGVAGAYGIIVNNSGNGGDEIYNNQFHDIGEGIHPQGQTALNSNEGLKIKCNDFTDNISFYHIAVPSGDIANPQGNCPTIFTDPDIAPTLPAGNTFTHECNFTVGDITAHSGTGFVYNHHSDAITTPVCTTTTVSTNNCFISYVNKQTACPSHLTNPSDPAEIQQRITNLTAQKDALKMYYDSVIDGGNTQSLLNTVATKPAGQIKNELLTFSPYISDTVLLAYLSKPITGKGHVPPGHVKEVIIANSSVTQKVINAVDSRGLPPGIQHEIDSSQTGISPRAELGQSIRYFETQRAIAVNELNRTYLNDTNLTNPLDSVISVLEKETNIKSKMQLAAAYISAGKYANAGTLLDSLSAIAALVNFVNIQNIILSIWSNGNNFDTIKTDTLIEQTVENIANDTLKFGYLEARGLLSLVFGYYYPEHIDEIIIGQPQAKMSNDQSNDKNTNNEGIDEYGIKEISLPHQEGKIILYPNPAKERIIIEYSFNDNCNGSVVFYDIMGRNHMIKLPGLAGKERIDLRYWNSGLYYYTIVANNNTIARDKIIIIK